MFNTIQYLNTDLVLESALDLTALTAAFEAAGASPLFGAHCDEGVWHSSINTGKFFQEPDANILALLDIVESLTPEQRIVWSNCQQREFNIGYDCGAEPWAFQQGLSTETLRRLADSGATLRWTLYPDRHDSLPQMKPAD